MKLTEGMIHVSMRRFLKREGWKLIAGEFPGGTDDELYVLSIVDPNIACDNSPDPRRHSVGELIPDLIATKDDMLLIIEAKCNYSLSDKEKLVYMLTEKKEYFYKSLIKFCKERKIDIDTDIRSLNLVPTLAFQDSNKIYSEDKGFAHIYIKNINEARMIIF